MTIEYGNWSELQKALGPNVQITEVSSDYQFQDNEIAYLESGTYSATNIYAGYIPTEIQFIDSFKKDLKSKGLLLLHCNLTIAKTLLGYQYGRAYYKIDANITKLVLQPDPSSTLARGFSLAVALVILAIVIVSTVAISMVLLPGLWYKGAGISPEDVSKYNDAQAKLWEQLIALANSFVALVAVAVVGLGIFTIYQGRKKG